MLVTNKINLFSFLFGKSHSSTMKKGNHGLNALTIKAKDLSDLEGRINVIKSDDFYRVNNAFAASPFTQLNR